RTVSGVALSPRGKILATGGARLIHWDPTRRNPLGEPLKPHGVVRSVAFSPDGKTLATGGARVILWDLARRNPLGEPLNDAYQGSAGTVSTVAFSPNGKILASSGVGGTIILWDVASRLFLRKP